MFGKIIFALCSIPPFLKTISMAMAQVRYKFGNVQEKDSKCKWNCMSKTWYKENVQFKEKDIME